MKKHILIYTQIFHPENFRVNDISIELIKLGYKVSILTGIPNYPEGKIYPGYRWNKKYKENWKGIDIYRVPIVPRGSNKIQLILNYISFVFSARLFQKWLPKDVDFVLTYEGSPVTQALPAIWFAKKFNINHYIYVLDLWPDNVVALTGIDSEVIIRPIEWIVDYIYKNSKKILVSSKSFAKSIIDERKISKEKLVYWPQFAEDFYVTKERNNTIVELPNFEERTFLFAGNLGQGQGLDLLPKSAKLLKDEKLLVKFVIIGDGREKENFLDLIKRLKVEEYFFFIDRQPAELIPYYLAKTDVGLITLNSNEIFEKTIPAKVQSLMACGVPILASADGEVQQIIKDSNSGFSSNAGDEIEFVKNVKKLLSMTQNELKQLGFNAKKYSSTHFNKNILMKDLTRLIEEEI